MSWFKVCDGLHDNRKVRRAGTAAMGLWALCGSWSASNLTDGFVPAEIAARYGTDRQAAKLVAVGLWEPTERDGEKGWLFHDWADYQPTRKEVEAKRAAASDRQAKARKVRKDSRSSEDSVTRDTDVSHGVSHASPDPSRPDPNGTYVGREGFSTDTPATEQPPTEGRGMSQLDGSRAAAGWPGTPAVGPDVARLAVVLVSEHVPVQPRKVADRLVAEAGQLLAEGIGGEQVAAGLRLWATKSVGAGLLAELVGEAMRAPLIGAAGAARSRSTTDARVAAALALASEYEAEETGRGPMSGVLVGAA
jgi:hypothetical protein